MQVKLAEKRGFCFGVERAIDLAEQLLVRLAELIGKRYLR